MLHMELRPLPPEPWGRRLLRARVDMADLKTREVAQVLNTYVFTSQATISRLEGREHEPTNSGQRARAYLCAILYGVAPAEFGVTVDDLPDSVKRIAGSLPERLPADMKDRRRKALKTTALSGEKTSTTRTPNDPPSRRYAQPVADFQAYRLLAHSKPTEPVDTVSELDKAA